MIEKKRLEKLKHSCMLYFSSMIFNSFNFCVSAAKAHLHKEMSLLLGYNSMETREAIGNLQKIGYDYEKLILLNVKQKYKFIDELVDKMVIFLLEEFPMKKDEETNIRIIEFYDKKYSKIKRKLDHSSPFSKDEVVSLAFTNNLVDKTDEFWEIAQKTIKRFKEND